MRNLTHMLLAFTALMPVISHASQAPTTVYGQELQGFDYPYPLHHFALSSQGQQLSMGYMDVAPAAKANGQTAVLMHGKNFCAATWEDSIKALSDEGYRVIAVDQVGFCTSSKPAHYQYSFQQLADNTHALLTSLGVDKVKVIGHSTGGMLAARYSLMYPQQVEQLVMVNPIGLEDWKAIGVPWRSIDQWYQQELKLSADSVRQYEQSTYYVGRWKPAYDRWVNMLVGLNKGPGHERVAWNSALIYDMIFNQPVYYELPNLKVPTLLMIGDKDNSAIGKDLAPPQVKARIGRYDQLGKDTAQRIPGARLIEFKGLGHAPQIEQPAQFNARLIEGMRTI